MDVCRGRQAATEEVPELLRLHGSLTKSAKLVPDRERHLILERTRHIEDLLSSRGIDVIHGPVERGPQE